MRSRIAVLLVCAAAASALAPEAGAKAPRHYPIGLYVTSVHDIDVASRTAGIDMWLWSISPDARRQRRRTEPSPSQ